MAVSEQLGLGVAIEGFKKFMTNMDKMDGAIGKQGKKWTGLTGIAGKAGKLLGGAVKVGLKAVAIGGAAAGAAVLGLGAAMFKLAKDAAPLEGIGTSFDVLSEKFGVSLDAMRDAAQGTVADFDLMKAANVALTGAGAQLGKEFGEALPGLLEAARAAAKATGQDVDFLFNSLVSGIKRGSPMLIDNTGLVLKLGEANEAMALSIGKTVEDLSAEEKQIAILRATLEAGSVMVNDFGSAQLTTAEKMARAKASMKNLTDQIGLALLPALDALFGAGGGITDVIGPKLIEFAQIAGQWLGENLPKAIQAASQWFEDTLIPALKATWKFTEEKVIPIIEETVKWLQENIPLAIKEAKRFWEDVLVPAMATAQKFIEDKVIPIIQKLAEWMGQDAPKEMGKLTKWFEDTLMPIIEEVATFFVEQWDQIKGWVEANMPLIQATIETVSDWLTDLWEWLWPHLVELVGEAWEIMKNAIETTIQTIQGILETVMHLIQGDWEEAWATFQETLATAWEGAKEHIQLALNAVLGIFDTTLPEFIQGGKDIIDGVVQGIKAAPGAIKDALLGVVQSAWQSVLDFLGISSPSTLFAEVGVGIIDGLTIGIINSANKPVEALQSVMDALAVAAEQALDTLWDRVATAAQIPDAPALYDDANPPPGYRPGAIIQPGPDAPLPYGDPGDDVNPPPGTGFIPPTRRGITAPTIRIPTISGGGGGGGGGIPSIIEKLTVKEMLVEAMGVVGPIQSMSSIQNTYNLTASSVMRDGGLSLEFASMAAATR